MLFPLKIDFQNMDASEFVAAKVRNRADKLAQFHDHVIGCHVTVQAPHRHHHRGNTYRVRIVVQVPGGTVVAGRDSGQDAAHTDVYVAIRDAFNAIERRLMSHTGRRRGDVKRHEGGETGRVVRVFPAEGYGFIELANGEEIYFHHNAVDGGGFARLSPGQAVRVAVAETESAQGPQATFVSAIAPMRAHR